MKGFVCSVCGFVSIDGAAPEKCPVCGAPKTAFNEKSDAIKTEGDSKGIGETEKKHIPFIKIENKCELIPDGCIDVNVKIGEIVHPMMTEHFIMHIDFYLDKKYISRIMFTPEKVNPAAGLHLRVKNGKFTAIESCNIHGNWIKEMDL